MTAVEPGKVDASGRRPAVWPWLLVPLVTLVVFFALRTARTSDVAPPDRPAATSQTADDAAD